MIPDKSSKAQPEDVVFCKKCVMSNQRPGSTIEFKNTSKKERRLIGFNNKGVCNACEYKSIKDNDIDWEEREALLKTLCDKYRSRNNSYDIIIPGSGGKDSVFTSHILKYKYNMNPLTITWAPHLYTNIGWQNFQQWINSGFDNILLTPNGKLHRLLTRKAFLNLCHPFQPFIIGQKICGPKYAALHKIPFVMYGEHAAEYGDRMDEAFDPKMKEHYFMDETNADNLILSGEPAKKICLDNGFNLSEMSPYLPIKPKTIKDANVQVFHLSYYIKWDPQEVFYYAAENAGFQANSERTQGSYSKYSSIDDKLDTLHYYTTLIKFGIGRATYDASQEIRSNKIDREEGVALVKKYDQEFPDKFFDEILEYMNITADQFWEVINKNRPEHLWEKSNNQWKLKHQVS
ncbi:MAG: LPS biosynthesis protein PseA [Alphaproteobacteria bacterium TMED62]|nr:MAG: LPS biosynthesis protein PseA [Alphaproteobacteria bacterium TMED62]|tara:strand:+ start:2989 stop:4197 length:1209 start_codon:yes stop_codon:yes gene_type:complete